MKLSEPIRKVLGALHEDGGFEEIKDLTRSLVNEHQVPVDAALDQAMEMFDAMIDFDRLLNGRFEKLGDALEAADGPIISALIRPFMRLAVRRLLKPWAQSGMP
jgi:hypothetical protein